MNEEFLDNQTLFAEEEATHTSRTRKKETVAELIKTKQKPVKLIIGVAVFILLNIIVLSIFLVKRGQEPVVTVEATPTPTIVQQNPSQIEQLLRELQSAVENADPSETILPFPPVSEKIRISQ